MKYFKKKRKLTSGQIVLHSFFILFCLCYILPYILLVSSSLEGSPSQFFHLFPQKFSLDAYKAVFARPRRIIDAYMVTIFYSVTGVLSSLFITSLVAYALSRKYFKLRKIYTFILFFTTLFDGGMVPTYVIYSRYLHLNDTIWIYILPGVMSAWNAIVIRTAFQNLPFELFESARIDGASEYRICFQIAIPLSTPVLASMGFIKFLGLWNDWMTSTIYIKNSRLVSLQALLKSIVDSVAFMQQMILDGQSSSNLYENLANVETMRFAMGVVGVGPALLVFPFFQKYFAKGMIVGSVKG